LSHLLFGLSRQFKKTEKAENRRVQRRKLEMDARILFKGGFASRPCRVLDFSNTGVRLLVSGSKDVPDEFTLLLDNRRRRACVKWRRGSQIGAEFV